MTNNTDHITGLSFDTTFAACLQVGRRYARTFDAAPRTLVRVIEQKGSAAHLVALVWSDTPEGKCSRVRLDARYFNR